MGIWDKLKGELIDIIEWMDETGDTLVWRFPRYQNEIKNGQFPDAVSMAKSIVESQQQEIDEMNGILSSL